MSGAAPGVDSPVPTGSRWERSGMNLESTRGSPQQSNRMELVERSRMMPLRYGVLTAALALGLLPLQAQVAPSPDAPPVSAAPDTPPPISEAPISKIKIHVDLVNFYFTARDR